MKNIILAKVYLIQLKHSNLHKYECEIILHFTVKSPKNAKKVIFLINSPKINF